MVPEAAQPVTEPHGTQGTYGGALAKAGDSCARRLGRVLDVL